MKRIARSLQFYSILISLGCGGVVLTALADQAFVAAEGRLSQVSLEDWRRRVASGWLLPASGLIAVSPVNGDIYASDQVDFGVYRINRTNGAVSLVSGIGVGAGPNLTVRTFGIAIEADGSPVVVDGIGGLVGVIRIDPETGNRSMVSAGSGAPYQRGTGLPFKSPFGITVETSGNLLVTDINRNAVIRVDRNTGNRTLVSGDPLGDNRGSGPDLDNPQAITIGLDGKLYVNDEPANSQRLFRIDPETGDRSVVITGLSQGDVDLYSLATTRDGLIAFAYPKLSNSTSTGGALFGIDTVSAKRVNISEEVFGPLPDNGFPRGAGDIFSRPIGVATDRDGFMIVSDVWVRAMFVIEPSSGNRSMLPNSLFGTGPSLNFPTGAAVQLNGNVLVADYGDPETTRTNYFVKKREPLVMEINPRTGQRTVMSAGSNTSFQRGSGSNFDQPRGMVIEASGNVLVVEASPNAPKLIRVDIRSGNRTIVSGPETGTGLRISNPHSVTLEANGTILLTDTFIHTVFRINPNTGNRTVLSGTGVGSGSDLNFPYGIACLEDGSIAVADGNLYTVVRIDPTTGKRSLLAGSQRGGGPALTNLRGLATARPGMLLATCTEPPRLVEINVLTGNRTIVASANSGSGPMIAANAEFVAYMPDPAPRLSPPERFANGSMLLRLTGTYGAPCVVESSSDLREWTQVGEVGNSDGEFAAFDTITGARSRSFYRARMLSAGETASHP